MLLTISSFAEEKISLHLANCPIDIVLSNLCSAAGFVVEIETPHINGNFNVIGENMTKSEVVHILDSQLYLNGYSAIRQGNNILRIMDRDKAIVSNNRVEIESSPYNVPEDSELVTCIVPVRNVESRPLISDLYPFVSNEARIVANVAANCIIITDTHFHIKHLLEIIKDIDDSAEDVNLINIFHLKYADANEFAGELSNLFPDNNSQTAIGDTSSTRIKTHHLVAAADERTSSLLVITTKDLMDEISEMVTNLDVASPKDFTLAIIPLNNADPQTILPVLQSVFSSQSASTTGNNQQSLLQYRIQQFIQNYTPPTLNNTMSTGVGNQSPRGNN